MFETILVMTGTPFFVLIYSTILRIPTKYFDLTGKQLLKPFNCSFCLSFWVSLFAQIFVCNNPVLIAAFASFPVPFIYNFIFDKINAE
jgi:hypothetical protein